MALHGNGLPLLDRFVPQQTGELGGLAVPIFHVADVSCKNVSEIRCLWAGRNSTVLSVILTKTAAQSFLP